MQLYRKNRSRWIVAAAIGAALAGFAPLPRPWNPPGPRIALAADRDRDRDEWIKYEDLPRDIKRSLDRERGDNEVKRIDHVFRDGREFYRAVIDRRGNDEVVRFDRDGGVLSRERVGDTGAGGRGYDARNERFDRAVERADQRQVRYNDLPHAVQDALDRERGRNELSAVYEIRSGRQTYYRADIADRGRDRTVYVTESGRLMNDADVREARLAGAEIGGVRRDVRDYGSGEEVAFDRLPGEVKAALGREAGADRVSRVIRYRSRDGHTVYRAEITNPNGTRIARVDESGRFIGESNATSEGKRFVRLNDLPGPVKDTIGREIPRDRLGSIVQITRDGRTYYRAEEDRGATSDWLTIDERGRVTGEIHRADYDRR